MKALIKYISIILSSFAAGALLVAAVEIQHEKQATAMLYNYIRWDQVQKDHPRLDKLVTDGLEPYRENRSMPIEEYKHKVTIAAGIPRYRWLSEVISSGEDPMK